MAHAPSPPNSRVVGVQVRPRGDRFLVIGDAACAFNPVYGQGMSVVGLTAEEIDRELRERRTRSVDHLASVSADLQRCVARINAAAWMVATGEDLRFPGTVGGRVSPADRMMRRYLDRIVLAAATDSVANAAFADVVTMTAPPTSLLRPRLAQRVLSRRSPRPSPAPPDPLRRLSPAIAALAG